MERWCPKSRVCTVVRFFEGGTFGRLLGHGRQICLCSIGGRQPFRTALDAGKVLQFRFNYREDYESDDAFLVGNGIDSFIVTGQIAELEYLHQHQPESPVEDEPASTDDELLDFSMF